MGDPLYFLSILIEALRQSKPQRSLEDAFAEITRIGSQDGHGEGFSNFELFMDIACSHAGAVATDHVRELIAELATDAPETREEEGMLLFCVIESYPVWKAEYEEMRVEQACQSPSSEPVPILGIFGPQGKVGEMVFDQVPGRVSVDGVTPGVYVLKLLNTGRVLWEGELTAQDLIWTAAYGVRDLDLAAQTEDAEVRPTREWVLWGGEVVLRTFAGTERGTIEVELTG